MSERRFQVSCSVAKRLHSEMNVSSVLWFEIFRFLDKEDLTRTAGVCFEWWTMTMRGPYLKELERDDLDLSGTESLYRFIPLRRFRELTRLNMASTNISNRHFQQIIRGAPNLEFLDISNCQNLEQSSIFHFKSALPYLEHVNISGNRNFTILAVASLCSCENIHMLVAHGYNFTAEELLFLTKTFESVSSGSLELETDDGYNPVPLMNAFEDELFDELEELF